MKLLFVLCVVLTPAQFLLVTESPTTSTTTADPRNPAGRILTLPTRKCSEIDSSEAKSESDACGTYCRSLRHEFTDGECVEGMCLCKLDIRDIIQAVSEKPRGKGKKRPGRVRNGVKCKNLIRFRGQDGPENHRGCGVHCRLNSPQNKDGRCVDGVCQCSKEVIEVTTTEKVTEEPEDECEACEVNCSKNKTEAHCLDGVCRCRAPPQQIHTDRFPDISIREGKRCDQDDELCRTHCEQFSRDHTEGRCVDGLCHCGYAVFEIPEPEPEDEKETENNNKQANNKTTRPPRGRGKQ